MSVKVFGFIPDPEVGEVPYESAVYHISLDSDGDPLFLVWNPYLSEWQTVEGHLVKPMSICAQDIGTKSRMKRVNELRKQREEREVKS